MQKFDVYEHQIDTDDIDDIEFEEYIDIYSSAIVLGEVLAAFGKLSTSVCILRKLNLTTQICLYDKYNVGTENTEYPEYQFRISPV